MRAAGRGGRARLRTEGRLLPELASLRVLRRLDGPVDDTVPADRPVTIRDLLTFRGGFGMILAPPSEYPILAADGAVEPYDDEGQWARRHVFTDCGAGLLSTAADYLAFGRMLLARGTHRGERILAPGLAAAMTTDQLTPRQRETGGLILGGRGWGLGVSIIDAPENAGSGPR
jgi:CubicO group peptidase (beta-lactamase class C family)